MHLLQGCAELLRIVLRGQRRPVPDGVLQLMLVGLATLTLVAAAPPMVTPVAPVKFGW